MIDRINRDAFLKTLANNEDDTAARLAYSDWLDEQGEHEEAERQREWPEAKRWLVELCEQNNDPDDEYEWSITYEELIELGRQAVANAAEDEDGSLWFSCGNNESMTYALRSHHREFWENWSVVTGIPLPPDCEDNTSFSCAC